jgi:hypothetical protein
MGEMSSIVIHLLIGYLKLVDSATVDWHNEMDFKPSFEGTTASL